MEVFVLWTITLAAIIGVNSAEVHYVDRDCDGATCQVIYRESGLYAFQRQNPNIVRLNIERLPSSIIDITNVPNLRIIMITSTSGMSTTDDICDSIIGQSLCVKVYTPRGGTECCSTPPTTEYGELTSHSTEMWTATEEWTVKLTKGRFKSTGVPSTLSTKQSQPPTPQETHASDIPTPLKPNPVAPSSIPSHGLFDRETVVAFSVSLAVMMILLIMLIVFHQLRVIRLKRLHIPLGHVSLDSSPTTTTSQGSSIRRSLSDSTLHSTVSTIVSPISSTPTPLLPEHRYPTRYQGRRIQLTE